MKITLIIFTNLIFKVQIFSGCESSYFRQTVRHIQSRVREHLGSRGTMKVHLEKCGVCPSTFSENSIKILHKSHSLSKLLALEALYINKIKPKLNVKDEFRSRTLTLKVFWFSNFRLSCMCKKICFLFFTHLNFKHPVLFAPCLLIFCFVVTLICF